MVCAQNILEFCLNLCHFFNKIKYINSGSVRHVASSDIDMTSSQKRWGHCLMPLMLLFREKSRLLRLCPCKRGHNASTAPCYPQKSHSAHLLGCKRPRHGSLSRPTFCEQSLKNLYHQRQVAAIQYHNLCWFCCLKENIQPGSAPVCLQARLQWLPIAANLFWSIMKKEIPISAILTRWKEVCW